MVLNGWQAVLLGLVQGLTEFLPVSSSGHLVLAQALLGIDADMLTFDVFVHVGTLAAVFVVFWSDIASILKKPFCRLTALIVVGCIPAGLMGLLLDDVFSRLFSSVVAVACALIVTGIILMISDHYQGTRKLEDMSFSEALLVGVCQGIAITPGISRSGSMIFGSLTCGLRRADAARFAFLASIPVILGAAGKECLDMIQAHTFVVTPAYFLGAAMAAISGYLAIRFFLRLLERKSLHYFSYYVWIVAIIAIIASLFV